MQKYWYVVEAHGRQVLIRKGENDEGHPSIELVAHADDGGEISFGLSFEPKEHGTIERSTEERDLVFGREEELRDMATAFAERLIGCATGMDAVKALQG